MKTILVVLTLLMSTVAANAAETARLNNEKLGLVESNLGPCEMQYDEEIKFVKISPDNKFVLIKVGFQDLKFYKMDGCKLTYLTKLETTSNIATSTQFSPDSKMVFASSDSGTSRLYKIENEKLIVVDELKSEKESNLTSVQFSPDSKSLLLANADSNFSLYKIENEKLIYLDGVNGWGARKLAIAKFSPDGSMILQVSQSTFDYSSVFIVFRIEDNKLKQLSGLSGRGWSYYDVESIVSANFSPDSKMILFSGPKKTVELYKIENGNVIYLDSIRNMSRVGSSQFSPDNKMILACSFVGCFLYEIDLSHSKLRFVRELTFPFFYTIAFNSVRNTLIHVNYNSNGVCHLNNKCEIYETNPVTGKALFSGEVKLKNHLPGDIQIFPNNQMIVSISTYKKNILFTPFAEIFR